MSDDPNNIDLQITRGDIKAALAAQTQQVVTIVTGEQIKRTTEVQRVEGVIIERFTHFFGEMDKRFAGISGKVDQVSVALHRRIDRSEAEMKALSALVEERTAPFLEIAQRVDTLEYGYAQLAEQVELALDPARHPQMERLEAIQNEDRQQAHEEMLDLDRALGRQLRVWALIIIVATVVVTSLISVVIHRVLYEAIR